MESYQKIVEWRLRLLSMILVTQKKLDLKRFVRYLVWIIIILAILWWSALGTNLNFGMLRGGLQGVADIVGRMVPPDFSILA